MKRSARHHALVDHLRARAPRPVSAPRLARELGVSTRTIERDVTALLDAGVPLYATAGRTGGYSILRDYSLPPLHLTADEAFACAVALELLAGSPFEASARRAVDKVVAGLPSTTVQALRAASPRVDRVEPHVPRRPGADVTQLPLAITDRRVVSLSYDAADGSTSVRDVEPLLLLEGGGAWYLVAWCRTRVAVRGFRTDRISRLAILDEAFTADHDAQLQADLSRWDRRALGRID